MESRRQLLYVSCAALAATACLLVVIAVSITGWMPWKRGVSQPPSVAGNSPPEQPSPYSVPAVIAVALDDRTRATSSRVTASWSAGAIAIRPEEPSFTIARDYNQRVVLEIENRGNEVRRIIAELGRLEHGLLGGFVGPGSADEPVEVGAQGKAKLDLYLFAQDAELRSYHTHATIKDATSGELLAVAPISILLPLPTFKLDARVGQPDPATLALPVTLVNQGGALSDLTVEPGRGLLGQVAIAPTMDHVALSHGGEITFWIHPRLSTSFHALEGDLILRGAGQEQTLELRFELPEGQRVFVARSFSTTSDQGAGGFCTNNPNTSTNVGGPTSDSSSDDWHLWPEQASDHARKIFGDQDIPGLPMDTSGRFKAGQKIGPVTVSFNAGAAPGSDPSGPIVDSNLTVKVGPYGKTLHTEVSVSPKVQEDLNYVNSPQRPAGRQLGGIDEGSVNYGDQGGAKNRPRGRSVRAAYLHDRPDIEADNSPEAMLAVGPGAAGERLMVQAWHSDVWCGRGGRQIALRVWDGSGLRPLSRAMLLSPEVQFAQWPAVLVLPDARALVVFEMAAERDAPPSLFYRVSGPGFGSWSPGIPVPGATASGGVGHFDPVAVMGPDGRITLLWQEGDGAESAIRISHSNEAGTFGEPTTPDELSAGAARPIARLTANGTLHLVFQARAQGGDTTAVYYARSADGGATLDAMQPISPEGANAGEPDLIARGQTVHAAFRVGPDWESRIHYAASNDGGSTWSDSFAITPDDDYAEFASLYLPTSDASMAEDATEPALSAHVGVEFYANKRSRSKRAGALIERFHSELRDGNWSAPERLLTNFPTIQSVWLQVNFRLKTTRLAYRPHDLSLHFNGVELLRLENAVPEGTYLLPVHPGLLCVDRSGLPHNVIDLRTRHMNPGSYSNAADFRLLTRHTMLERFVVAADKVEADSRLAAESPTVNHARPDAGLFAMYARAALPASPDQGETITLPLAVGNLGEAPADDVRIEVYDRDPTRNAAVAEPLVKPIDEGRLSPMELRRTTIRFPYGGKEQYFVVVRSSGDDFDPKNNIHAISFAVPPPPATPPREPATDVVDLADDADPPFLCRILDAETGDEVQRMNNGRLAGPLPPGKYRLALTRYENEGVEVVFPQVFDLGADSRQDHVKLRTAVELDVPRNAGPIDRWELVRADSPDAIVQWHFGRHQVMLVPPGEYRVAIRPTQDSEERIVLDSTIALGADQHRVVRLGSGLRLEMPDGIAPITSWAIVRVDKPTEIVQAFEAADRLALVQPGDYHVAFVQSDGEAVVWPQVAEVRDGTFAVLRIPASFFVPSADLRDWKPAGPARSARWTLFPDGKGVTLTHTSTEPAFFIRPESHGDVTMRCSIRIEQSNPTIRGVIGLVLGYQGPNDADDPEFEFIMLKWSNELAVPSRNGMYLVRVKGTFADNYDKLFYLVEPECEILARTGEPKWIPGKERALAVRYEQNRIQVALDGKTVLEAEGGFAPGRVGFHGFGYGDTVSFSSVTFQPLATEN